MNDIDFEVDDNSIVSLEELIEQQNIEEICQEQDLEGDQSWMLDLKEEDNEELDFNND